MKKVSIYRFSDTGFCFTQQTHLPVPINGCHVFVEHIDEYLLTGIASFRKEQKLNHKEICEDTIVLGRNLVYSVRDNGFGYDALGADKLFEDKGVYEWVEMPLWVVAENALMIKKHDPVGHFGCEAILF